MDFTSFITELQQTPEYSDQIVYIREIAPREARFTDLLLAEPLQTMLRDRGISRLYTHQGTAIQHVREGEHVLVATGTASGKSLCYTLPILETLLEDPHATALLLFPMKALCQDQFRTAADILRESGLKKILAGVYDGDTPSALRRKLRDQGSLIFTNPDMLHAGVMPQHARWASYLSNLKYIVLDELHVYTGIFGSNMANLLRRLLRLCRHYGSSPQFIACSATIGNPGVLAERLTGFPFTLVNNDGSPCGKRTYVFWNPPPLRATTWRSRRSANVEAHELMAALVQRGVRTITFSKAKMTAEMIFRYVEEKLQTTAPHLAGKLASYRGGYLPEERREIERRLFNGELLGVSTTRALELGIDVGGLDASILVGYPGTLASFFQQSGRAGRAADEALVILVGLDTPANQFIMSRPDYLFERPVEEGIIDPDNPYIISGHLRCATQELALPDAELATFGPFTDLVLTILQENCKVHHVDACWYHAAGETPQHEISLRSYSDATVLIEDVDSGAVLGEMDKYDAPPLLHPQAIYIHQGDTYIVLTLDLERNIARVKRIDVDYYTQPLGGTDIHHIDHQLRDKHFGSGMAYWGEVTAHFHTNGFEKVRFYELDAISRHVVKLPTFSLETMAVWLVPPEWLMEQVRRAGLDAFSGLRGIGYAMRMLLPLFITCDTLDFSHTVGSVNAPWNAVFIYERYPNGLGFTERVYEKLAEIMPVVLATVTNCPCEDGCLCCVGKPLRGELVWNPERGEAGIPSKDAAKMILEGLLAAGHPLQTMDAQMLTGSLEAEASRLSVSLRRRLERMREPKLFHPINPDVKTAIPDAENPETLPTPDVAHRGTKRRDFHRELSKRIAKHIETGELPPNAAKPAPPPGMNPGFGANTPHAFPGRPGVTREQIETPPLPTEPKPMGDSIAARARRMKREQPPQK